MMCRAGLLTAKVLIVLKELMMPFQAIKYTFVGLVLGLIQVKTLRFTSQAIHLL